MIGDRLLEKGERASFEVRTALQVARRAVIATALALRASLEVADHPRSAGVSANILPWLTRHGINDELDPIEREILETPYRQLRDNQITDVNWSGEAAWIFAWALGVVERPPPLETVDYGILVKRLEILRTDPSTLISSATLRDDAELAEFCTETLAIRTQLQRHRLPDASPVLDQLLFSRLRSIGLSPADQILRSARTFVEALSERQRSTIAGIYCVRDLAVTWLFDDRPSYFGEPEPDAY